MGHGGVGGWGEVTQWVWRSHGQVCSPLTCPTTHLLGLVYTIQSSSSERATTLLIQNQIKEKPQSSKTHVLYLSTAKHFKRERKLAIYWTNHKKRTAQVNASSHFLSLLLAAILASRRSVSRRNFQDTLIAPAARWEWKGEGWRWRGKQLEQ